MPKSVSNIKSEEQLLQLLQENALLKGIIQGATDAVYAKDLDGKYLIINQKGADYFKRPINEIVGKTDVELVGEGAGRSIMDHDVNLFQ
ncbi:MAG: two-component system cell cycle sensor histidine kinase/response regulator CckA, partial [Polaribacter sp.]